jgi:hypothetical protein
LEEVEAAGAGVGGAETAETAAEGVEEAVFAFLAGGAASFFSFSASESESESLDEEESEEEEESEDEEEEEPEVEAALRFLALTGAETGAARVGGPGLGFFALTALSDSSSESESSEEEESLSSEDELSAALAEFAEHRNRIS